MDTTSQPGTLDVERSVGERYSKGAQEQLGSLCCPIQYDQRYLRAIPQEDPRPGRGGCGLSPTAGLVAVTLAMALGGLIGAHRVAETISRKITPMSVGQGLAGNLTTSLLVIGASRFGLPVSTTHVSTGGIFGVGFTKGEVRWGTVGGIMATWVTMLPVAALLGAAAMLILRTAA